MSQDLNGSTTNGGVVVDEPAVNINDAHLVILIGQTCSSDEVRLTLGLLNAALAQIGKPVQEHLADIVNAIRHKQYEKSNYDQQQRIGYSNDVNFTFELLVNPLVRSVRQSFKNALTSERKHKFVVNLSGDRASQGDLNCSDASFSCDELLIMLADTAEFSDEQRKALKAAQSNKFTILMPQRVLDANRAWKSALEKHYAGVCVQAIATSGSASVAAPPLENLELNESLTYLLNQTPIDQLLASSKHTGTLKVTRPSLYIFPSEQGDAAYFALNGYSMLINGGYDRLRPSFWKFVNMLQQIDSVLLTHADVDALGGLVALFGKKAADTATECKPQVLALLGNLVRAKPSPSQLPHASTDSTSTAATTPIAQKTDVDAVLDAIEKLNVRLMPLVKNNENLLLPFNKSPSVPNKYEHINLYSKLGHGSLDLYVLSPYVNSPEYKEFYHQQQQAFARQTSANLQKAHLAVHGVYKHLPLSHLASSVCLLVWLPAAPTHRSTAADPAYNALRLLFTGNAPQHVILNALDKLKDFELLNEPVYRVKAAEHQPHHHHQQQTQSMMKKQTSASSGVGVKESSSTANGNKLNTSISSKPVGTVNGHHGDHHDEKDKEKQPSKSSSKPPVPPHGSSQNNASSNKQQSQQTKPVSSSSSAAAAKPTSTSTSASASSALNTSASKDVKDGTVASSVKHDKKPPVASTSTSTSQANANQAKKKHTSNDHPATEDKEKEKSGEKAATGASSDKTATKKGAVVGKKEPTTAATANGGGGGPAKSSHSETNTRASLSSHTKASLEKEREKPEPKPPVPKQQPVAKSAAATTTTAAAKQPSGGDSKEKQHHGNKPETKSSDGGKKSLSSSNKPVPSTTTKKATTTTTTSSGPKALTLSMSSDNSGGGAVLKGGSGIVAAAAAATTSVVAATVAAGVSDAAVAPSTTPAVEEQQQQVQVESNSQEATTITQQQQQQPPSVESIEMRMHQQDEEVVAESALAAEEVVAAAPSTSSNDHHHHDSDQILVEMAAAPPPPPSSQPSSDIVQQIEQVEQIEKIEQVVSVEHVLEQILPPQTTTTNDAVSQEEQLLEQPEPEQQPPIQDHQLTTENQSQEDEEVANNFAHQESPNLSPVKKDFPSLNHSQSGETETTNGSNGESAPANNDLNNHHHHHHHHEDAPVVEEQLTSEAVTTNDIEIVSGNLNGDVDEIGEQLRVAANDDVMTRSFIEDASNPASNPFNAANPLPPTTTNDDVAPVQNGTNGNSHHPLDESCDLNRTHELFEGDESSSSLSQQPSSHTNGNGVHHDDGGEEEINGGSTNGNKHDDSLISGLEALKLANQSAHHVGGAEANGGAGEPHTWNLLELPKPVNPADVVDPAHVDLVQVSDKVEIDSKPDATSSPAGQQSVSAALGLEKKAPIANGKGKSSRASVDPSKPSTTTTTTSNSTSTRATASSKPIHPAYVELAYVPAHGSESHVDAEFFKRVRARHYVLSALEPSEHALNALCDGKEVWEDKQLSVTLVPTYESETLRKWFMANEERLQRLKIDITPAAQHATITMDDNPELACQVYKLEF